MYTHTEENFLPAEVVLTQASSGKRLANYLIDMAVFYAFTFLIGVVLALVFDQYILDYEDTAVNTLIERLISMALYGLLLGLTEGVCKEKVAWQAHYRYPCRENRRQRVGFRNGIQTRPLPHGSFQ